MMMMMMMEVQKEVRVGFILLGLVAYQGKDIVCLDSLSSIEA